eukprot:15436258-Alexandrium_andersonii.AAC.1
MPQAALCLSCYAFRVARVKARRPHDPMSCDVFWGFGGHPMERLAGTSLLTPLRRLHALFPAPS